MKTLLKLSAIISTMILIAIGCQKNLSDENSVTANLDINKAFNAASVKEWYYGTFKKSAEWKSSSQQGKKLPDWKNGVYHKVGNMEIIEFPLVKAKTTISVPSGNNLTSSEIKRITEASLTRIAFIKTANNKITVRELDYIPDWEYLKAMNYDINSISTGKSDNSFSGRIVTKTWGGKALFTSKIANGRFTGKGIIKQQPPKGDNTSNTEGCTVFQICEWERYC